mmetsp:Transcript_3442/g.12392  ORF Transcript_3442/g.12392 Transcript_3442/m.12392 type:complete len:209 (-) Transcript_3442:2496-3122(-)
MDVSRSEANRCTPRSRVTFDVKTTSDAKTPARREAPGRNASLWIAYLHLYLQSFACVVPSLSVSRDARCGRPIPRKVPVVTQSLLCLRVATPSSPRNRRRAPQSRLEVIRVSFGRWREIRSCAEVVDVNRTFLALFSREVCFWRRILPWLSRLCIGRTPTRLARRRARRCADDETVRAGADPWHACCCHLRLRWCFVRMDCPYSMPLR